MATITITGKGKAARRLARLLSAAGHSCVPAEKDATGTPDLLLVEADTPKKICAFIDSVRSGAVSYVPALLAAGEKKTLARAVTDLVDDVIEDGTRPSLVKLKVEGLLRMKRHLNGLVDEQARMSRRLRRLEEGAKTLDHELKLATRLQESLLPPAEMALPGAHFSTRILPFSSVSGDFFDIFRLDETHVGFYIADARGHGVPAALLTIYIKKGLWTKDIDGHNYRIVPPAETLARLNNDLLAEGLADSHFITICYCVYNVKTRTLVYSHGGHPPALLVRAGGAITELEEGGPLLGVLEDEYDQGSVDIAPGDKLVLYSDGFEHMTLKDDPDVVGLDAFNALVGRFADLPVQEMVKSIINASLANGLDVDAQDDITVLAMEALEQE